jgi:hypothetical protein
MGILSIRRPQSGIVENSSLLECYAVCTGKSGQTFQRSIFLADSESSTLRRRIVLMLLLHPEDGEDTIFRDVLHYLPV